MRPNKLEHLSLETFSSQAWNLSARPEPTQLLCLSEASFLGKLLVLPANVRLNWKVIARYEHPSLFGLVISNEEKKFYNIGPRINQTYNKQYFGNLMNIFNYRQFAHEFNLLIFL
jgi:hypothetical protein